MLLHKAQANWHYLIIAELRPMYDSIPINLRTGSQAELGKKESRWAKRAERGLGERKWREILFWCLQSWVSRCARGTPHPTAGRTTTAVAITQQVTCCCTKRRPTGTIWSLQSYAQCMTPFQLTCEQALKPSWAKKRVGEQSEPRGAWGRGNGGRSCFDVSSLGCLDAPAVLPTRRLGARA